MQLTYLNYRNVQETVAKFEERKLFTIFEKHDVVNNIMNSSPVVKLTITNTTTTTTVSSTATNSNNNNTDIDVVNVVLQSLIANLKEIISKIFIEFENSIKFDPIHSGSLFIIIDTSINILLII